MQTPRTFAVLALLALGCSYASPTDDAKYHLACYSQDSCPSGWTCGSAWQDDSLCADVSRQGTRQGNIKMSDGSIVWGNGPSEPTIAFSCINELTPVPAVGEYCYQTAPTCGDLACAAGQKCGYAAAATGVPLVLKCLDPSAFSGGGGNCGTCGGSYGHCYAVLEPGPQGSSYLVCSSQS